MSYATITSKMQLTIPINIAKLTGVKTGEKVYVESEKGRIVLTPAKLLLSELAGSVETPKKFADKDIDSIIKEAKANYFKPKK